MYRHTCDSVLIVPFMELKQLVMLMGLLILMVLIVPFMELKLDVPALTDGFGRLNRTFYGIETREYQSVEHVQHMS